MRRTRIRPGAPPKVRLNKAGQPRERFEGLRDEAFREWIRQRSCLIGPARECIYRRTPEGFFSDAAHVSTKARGTGDAGQLVPLCERHHRDQHQYGIKSFEREYGVSLRQAAGALWLQYEAERGAPTL